MTNNIIFVQWIIPFLDSTSACYSCAGITVCLLIQSEAHAAFCESVCNYVHANTQQQNTQNGNNCSWIYWMWLDFGFHSFLKKLDKLFQPGLYNAYLYCSIEI